MTASAGLDFLTGWRDGTRAARSELDRRLRLGLRAYGLTLDIEGRIVGDPGISEQALSAPRPAPRPQQLTNGAYTRGREQGWHATWQDGLERLREELAAHHLTVGESAELASLEGHAPARRAPLQTTRWGVTPQQALPVRAPSVRPATEPPVFQASVTAAAPHAPRSRLLPTEAFAHAPSPSVLSRIGDLFAMVLRKPNRRAALVTLASGLVAAGSILFAPPSKVQDQGEAFAAPSNSSYVAPSLWDLESNAVRSGLLSLDRRFHELEHEEGVDRLRAQIALDMDRTLAAHQEVAVVERVLLVRWVRDRARADLLDALLCVYKESSDVRVRRAVTYTIVALTRQLGKGAIAPSVRSVLEEYQDRMVETDPNMRALLRVALLGLS